MSDVLCYSMGMSGTDQPMSRKFLPMHQLLWVIPGGLHYSRGLLRSVSPQQTHA